MTHPSRRRIVEALIALGCTCPAAPLWGLAPTPLAVRRGINVWPWFALTREYPPPSRNYGWPPFQSDRPRPSAKDLAALRNAGFDFVRLPVDPGPFLAMRGDQRNQLTKSVEHAIDSILGADLSVILNLHPNDATHYWNGRQMLDEGPQGSFALFTELVIDAARLLRRAPRHRVALELVNEPLLPCDSKDWPRQQANLLGAARTAAPELTFVLTGSCGSLPEGLLAFVPPQPSDMNIFYTFHYYEPYIFSHQGAAWTTRIHRYLRNVPWPAAFGNLAETEAAFRAQIATDKTLSTDIREYLLAKGRYELAAYFESNADKSLIERDFSRITEWRELHGIPADRILLGEFGATKWAGRMDRARYLQDVRNAAEAQGFAWAFWNLFDSMGLTLDDQTRVFDGAIIRALGLNSSI